MTGFVHSHKPPHGLSHRWHIKIQLAYLITVNAKKLKPAD